MEDYWPVAPDPEGKLKRICPHCNTLGRRESLKLLRRRKKGDGIYFCNMCRKCSIELVRVKGVRQRIPTDQKRLDIG